MISFSHLTDTGKKRDHNEDFYELNDELGVYIVCDGMGGHAAGEVASELTATTILKILKKNQKIFLSLKSAEDTNKRKRISELIKKAVDEANRTVYNMSMEDPSKRGMGTTLVMAIVTEIGTFVAHVGDSRAYLVRKGNVQQLTEDHSLVNELLRSGVITKEAAANHPQGNVITKAIGIHEVVTPDVLFYETMEGDTIFLCSDGLHDYLKKEDILNIRSKCTIKTLAAEFVKFANFKGGKDNITCICLQFGDNEAPPAHPSNITVDTKVQTLKKIPLFAGLNYKEISQILEIIQIRNIEPGTQIITEGKTGEDMFVILKGHVTVLVQGQKVNKLKPGQFFGEMSLIDKSPRSASIITVDEVKVMRLTRSDFFPLLKKESRIGLKVFWAFLQNMNKRLRDNDKLLFSITQEQMGSKEPVSSSDEGPEKNDFDLSMLDK
ncbi:MAG: Stp1/IreP family PP2C-type Ser/Thr phosphatase [Halobacteriovoraceae bacterium]|nr:Stp1/IreP family PP2C-type Ser/Thr phosphatase [Halobacteriovoraceae bacterium]